MASEMAGNTEATIPEAATLEQEPDLAFVVAGLFADVFEVESVNPDDNFFHMGGDSLLAATLMAAIETRFGTALSISTLLEAPTPRKLAEGLLEATIDRAGDALVVVRGGGKGPAIFCVHGINGVAFFPRKLAEALGEDRPICGFRAIGLQSGERPFATVEEIAENYLAALRRVQKEGPYLLLGHCGCSLVAYEMAQQLTAAGESVAGLMLIDPLSYENVAPYLFNSGLALRLIHVEWEKRAKALQSYVDRTPDMTLEDRSKTVRAAMVAAVTRYVPKPFGGKTLLLCTTARKKALLNPQRGLPTLAPDCQVVEIKSVHGDIFEQHMPEIVAAIAPFMNRVAPLP
jgi:thioesterase domain-containing protein/acyl carrier protein